MRTAKKLTAFAAAGAIVLSPVTATAQAQSAPDVNKAEISKSYEEIKARVASGDVPAQKPLLIDGATASSFDPLVNELIDRLQRLYGGIYPWMVGIIPGLPTDLPLDQFRPVVSPEPPRPTSTPTSEPTSEPTTSTSPTTVPVTSEPTTSTPPVWTRPTNTITPPVWTRPTNTITLPPRPTVSTTSTRPTTSTTTPRPTTSTTTPRPTTPTPPPAGCPAGDRSTAPNPDRLTQEIHDAVNAYRVSKGLRPLVRNTALERVAYGWSTKMAWGGPVMHNPNLANEVPSCNRGVGENISGTTGVMTAQKVVEGWRNSPGHNANMLNPRLTDMGIGVAKGLMWSYATANFGVF